MQVPGFIKQIPSHFQQAWGQVAGAGQTTKNWMANRLHAQRDYWSQTEFWQQHAKPLYERNIKPLDKTDAGILTGSLVTATAAVVAALSIEFFFGFFPLVMAFDAFIVFGACSYSQGRIQNKFNELAWEHVDQIRRVANDITYKNQKFSEISHHRGLLNKPEFKHLKSHFKGLNEEIRQFRQVVLGPYSEEKKQMVTLQIDTLKTMVQAHPQDLALIADFEKEMNKIGTEQQNLGTIEQQKNMLQRLQTPTARLLLPKLEQQINDLLKTAQGPNFMDGKKAFIKYLENLQDTLAKHKTIQTLIPRGPLDRVPSPDSIAAAKDKKELPLDEVLIDEMVRE